MAGSAYDAHPYPGRPFAQTHPDRLATLASLYGLHPPRVETCSVLELGCGDGGNLIPMALALPEARFAGIDAAPQAIGRAEDTAAELELDNVEFDDELIERYDPEPGGFDYVIAHGVYSWVPEPVRERLLAVCSRALSDDGVAYVSYNALPGGRLRQGLREMLAFHTDGIADPAERAAQARALLELLSASWPEGQELGATLGGQARQLLERRDETIFHDELSPVNEPVYFHQFAAHAARRGLQYLTEADFFETQTGTIPPAAVEALGRIADPIRREQYVDFVKGRMFRQTLLCAADRVIDRTPRPEAVERMAVSAPVEAEPDPDSSGGVRFVGPAGSALRTDHPAVIDALRSVGRAWPRAVPVRSLLPEQASAREVVLDALLRCYAGNLVHLHSVPPQLVTRAGERPAASPLARLQAGAGGVVTNQRHAGVLIEDELGRRLVTLLDGTRDRDELIEALAGPGSAADPDTDFAAALDRGLGGLAAMALLVA